MSAQDDVLAAFGEPPRWPRTPDEAAEEIQPGIQAEIQPENQAADTADEAGEIGDGRGEPAGDSARGDATDDDAADGDADVAVEKQIDGGPTEAGASEQPAGAAAEAAATKSGDAGTATEAAASKTAPEPTAAGAPAEPTTHVIGVTGVTGTPGPTDPLAATIQTPIPTPTPTSTPALTESPAQPYLDPAAFFAQLQAEAAPKPKPRWPRLLLRYGSAVVVAGAVGAGTAYAVTLPRRTDVPFLATASDGRYSFLDVTHPVPPAGEPAPGADDNQTQTHYGDLRQYLVPAPVGVVPKESGWEPVADFENSLSGNDVSGHLYDAGIRRVAWRGWTAADGQHTVVELLQFPDHEAAFSVASLLDGASLAKASQPESVVPELTVPGFGDTTSTAVIHKFDQVIGLPGQKERRVVFQSGDVVAIVTATAPAKVPDTPTVQVALLEAGMLR